MQINTQTFGSLKDDIYKWIKETVMDASFDLADYLEDNDHYLVGIAVLGDNARGVHMGREMVNEKLGDYIDSDDEDKENFDLDEDNEDLDSEYWDYLTKITDLLAEELNQEITQETGLELSIGFGTSDQGDYLAFLIFGKDDGAKIIKKIKKLITENKFNEE